MAVDKKSAAQELYNVNFDQNSIAKILDVTPKTISDWKKKYRWEEKRAKKNMSREVSENDVWELINYQSAALKAKKDEWQRKFDAKELQELPMLDKGDVDALQKLWTTVKGKQLDWSVVVNNLSEFVGFLSERDLELSQQILDHVDDFMNYKRKNL